MALNASGLMLAHVAGAAIFALGTLAWAVRATEDPAIIRRAVTGFFCFFLLKSSVTLVAQLSGIFTMLGWAILLIDISLCLLKGRALFSRRASAARLAWPDLRGEETAGIQSGRFGPGVRRLHSGTFSIRRRDPGASLLDLPSHV